MSKIINEFLSRYEKEFDFYQNLAVNIERKIKNELSRYGVRTIVSSRAKSTSRLDVKLEDRNGKKNYKTVNDIYEDIVDLAGVRVALYFPGDMKTVEEIIKKNFKIHKVKRFSESEGKKKIGDYLKVFDGYSAVHFRVSLNDESRYGNNHCVEIQVASVLMHAWSEVEHDLIYKPLQGDLSYEELMILDEINGLVLSGNIALERLQKAGQNRVNNESNNIFLNHYDLAAFLLSKIEINEEFFDFRTLFFLLKSMGLNKKDEITKLLEGTMGTSSGRSGKKRNAGHSLESFLYVLTEQHPKKIIKFFISKQCNDNELFDLIYGMAWQAIELQDKTGSVVKLREELTSLYFEFDCFGREYIYENYDGIIDIHNFSDEEVLHIFSLLEEFDGKMHMADLTEREIDNFISQCQNITVASLESD
ncbi:GTP pyrophosphokinase [Pectobacterium punjabense]|uniref:GTP pyrophosphokinase n=1 Tax=Pectobacterium punjabense TaxID=2108399 RepID=UPI001968BFD7|nr:RelA/SpoT domain-containing protein [Pectobacterium punjabense]MBN3135496.1 RelA/SpoT domain-containing protein [Pectobacterium punjabense]MCE5379685.1 RelA/SpoT domain-containing protein [Pectobacterium punjabense]